MVFIGDGKYAYLEASLPRQHGDIVRLISPKMQGAKCMSIMYHMYGSTMGSLIIYMKMNGSETVEWIKSGNHPDQWFETAVFFNSSAEYEVTKDEVYFYIPCCFENITGRRRGGGGRVAVALIVESDKNYGLTDHN